MGCLSVRCAPVGSARADTLRPMRGIRWIAAAAVAGCAIPGTAAAAGTGTVDAIRLPGATSSVALAPDGSVWTSLPMRRTVARIAPDGSVTESNDLTGAPAGVTVAAGKVWVAVTSAKKVVAFDLASTDAFTSTATPAGSCGPVGITAGNDGKVYVSLPNDGTVATCSYVVPSELLPISATGVAGTPVAERGQAFDLVSAGGQLWVPDGQGNVLRRLSLDASLTVTGTFPLPAGSGARGIGVAPDGTIAVGLANTHSVARVGAVAPNGTAAEIFATQVPSPAGIASAHGSLYVAGSGLSGGAATIRRFPSDGSLALPITPLAAAEPWDVSPGPDGTVLFTDRANERLIRFISRPPRAVTGGVAENSGALARIDAGANPGGNAAVVTVEYGPTTAYGASAVAVPTAPGVLVASGTADVALRAELKDLKLSTTYHYRTVVVTPEGTAVGEDRTFTTAATAPIGAANRPQVVVTTRKPKRGTVQLRAIKLSNLVGGEQIVVTCAGAGCPSKKNDRTFRTTAKRAGELAVKPKKLLLSKLRRGAKVTVAVTKPGRTGVVATATVGKNSRVTFTTRCMAAGDTKRSAC